MTLVDRDGVRLASYRKTHLWDPFNRFESVVFRAGATPPPVATLLGVRLGLLICWDVEFPENCRALALQGAQLIISIAANAYSFVLSHIVPVRAFENLLHVVYCNLPGPAFCGCSRVCAPNGAALLALPADGGDACGVATIDRQAAEWAAVAQRNPFFSHRRPALYAPLTL